VFGKGATVLPGAALAVRELALRSADPAATSFTANATFAAGQPHSPARPVAALEASSLTVGRCDGLTLNGGGSLGSGGRDMAFHFSAASASGHSIANLTAALDSANARGGGRGVASVTLSSEAMAPGSAFAVTLTATNFLGFAANVTVTVAKLTVPAPVLRVIGGGSLSVGRSESLSLVAAAEIPAMACVAYNLESAKMSFVWTELTGAFTGPLAGTSKNPRELAIAANALTAKTTYTFRVTGFMTDSPNVNNSATVSVVVGQQALKAVVGSAFRQVGTDSSFTLDGSGSHDPDESAAPLEYAWTCAGVSGGATCGELDLGTGAAATVGANALASGTYAFTLTVAKAGRDSAQTASVVEVTAGSPPLVDVAALAKDKYVHAR